ncbi:PLP-dependent aminotransferase family protein [Siphonobacter sp. SORGH_AS_0500]|uniref:aminotransferase-like domain-containing protein n=1 Tax=Siphonobacter sp. SORGH_AS_0500 TaxID=1864824 RepID=UPI0028660B76|nr:PLP-dependent aminotransferase family protein [Siphonobacter sp. SORGH_AS_0500]MDR6196866.1 GntR family transcriptional regulator/MocR family aminotransferase [Siphonobacter sp. SORGH_AS_0500]
MWTFTLTLDRTSSQPLYLQLSTQLMDHIRSGQLLCGQQLPSSRKLAERLQVHRKTIVQAYDELLAQGWLESRQGSGTFVTTHFPESKPSLQTSFDPLKTAGFSFESKPFLERPPLLAQGPYHLDDGFPDVRLAPLLDLSRAYRNQLLRSNAYSRLGYNDPMGSGWLREQLSLYLNETRGLHTTAANVLIVRGTMMGFFLTSTAFVKPGDYVALDSMSWSGSTLNLEQTGARMLSVPVDEHGLQVEVLAELCQQYPIRMLYLTSHHHYPTTVALKAERRMKLMSLSRQYGFLIFEDDYDFDFHYEQKPLFPLASVDTSGMVMYCGSFTKTIAPAFRVGYLVGPEDAIRHLSRLRRIIDRQGDMMLENALAQLLEEGLIQRHLRKALRIYKKRRDYFAQALSHELADNIHFQTPEGGLAFWTQFKEGTNLVEVASKALKKGLYFSNGIQHGPLTFPSTRLGFASSNEEELSHCVKILKSCL